MKRFLILILFLILTLYGEDSKNKILKPEQDENRITKKDNTNIEKVYKDQDMKYYIPIPFYGKLNLTPIVEFVFNE